MPARFLTALLVASIASSIHADLPAPLTVPPTAVTSAPPAPAVLPTNPPPFGDETAGQPVDLTPYGPLPEAGPVAELHVPDAVFCPPASSCEIDESLYDWNWILDTGVSYFDFPSDSRVGGQTILTGYKPLLDDVAFITHGSINLFDGGEQLGGSVGIIKAPTSMCSLYDRLGGELAYDSFTDTRFGSPYIGSLRGNVELMLAEDGGPGPLGRVFSGSPLIGGVRWSQTVTGTSLDIPNTFFPGVPGVAGVVPGGSTRVPFQGVTSVGGYLAGQLGVNRFQAGASYLDQADLAIYDLAVTRPLRQGVNLRLLGSVDERGNSSAYAGVAIALGRLRDRCGRGGGLLDRGGCTGDACCRADRSQPHVRRLARTDVCYRAMRPQTLGHAPGLITATADELAAPKGLTAGGANIVLVAGETNPAQQTTAKPTQYVSIATVEKQVRDYEEKLKKIIRDENYYKKDFVGSGSSGYASRPSTITWNTSDIKHQIEVLQSNIAPYYAEVDRVKRINGPDARVDKRLADIFVRDLTENLSVLTIEDAHIEISAFEKRNWTYVENRRNYVERGSEQAKKMKALADKARRSRNGYVASKTTTANSIEYAVPSLTPDREQSEGDGPGTDSGPGSGPGTDDRPDDGFGTDDRPDDGFGDDGFGDDGFLEDKPFFPNDLPIIDGPL